MIHFPDHQILLRQPRKRFFLAEGQGWKVEQHQKYLEASVLDNELKTKIEGLINQGPIVLFMKGNKTQPMCGFSAQVVNILNKHKMDFASFDILADWDVREGLKEYSHWPTFPQLYVNGELIGGCDIVMELDRKGELTNILKG